MTSFLPYFFVLTSMIFLYSCSASTEKRDTTLTISSKPLIDTVAHDSVVKLKLCFVGDIMQHDAQIATAKIGENKFDYDPSFRYIKPILEQADIAVGNLELTLKEKPRYSGYPCFKAPDTLAWFLKEAGFDLLATANNHSNDNNKYGVIHTLEQLDHFGIPHTGTFKDSADFKANYPLIMEKNIDGTTFRLAFINYTYATNGIPTPKPTIVNRIDTAKIKKDIQAAKAENPDMIIAMMHWGHEYHINEYPTQQKLTKMLWDNGVDLVIGSHPHVIQPVKSEKRYSADSSDSRVVVVTYSLGNFISNFIHASNRKFTDIGLLFEVELEKNVWNKKTQISDHDYVFVWRHIYNYGKPLNQREHTVFPTTAVENDSTNFMGLTPIQYQHMISTTEKMRKHMSKFGSKERKIKFEDIVSKNTKKLY